MIDILTQSSSLSLIVNKVTELSKLNRLVQEKLGSELGKYCRVANLRDGILVLVTSSPATGHLLRFAISDLLAALRAEPKWCHLKSIKTLVHREQPIPPIRPNLSNPLISMSTSNQQLIATIANNIDNSSLQLALKKLSQKKPTII